MIFKIYARKYKFKGLRYGEILFVIIVSLLSCRIAFVAIKYMHIPFARFEISLTFS